MKIYRGNSSTMLMPQSPTSPDPKTPPSNDRAKSESPSEDDFNINIKGFYNY